MDTPSTSLSPHLVSEVKPEPKTAENEIENLPKYCNFVDMPFTLKSENMGLPVLKELKIESDGKHTLDVPFYVSLSNEKMETTEIVPWSNQIFLNQSEPLVKIEKNEWEVNESDEQIYEVNFEDWRIKDEKWNENLESSGLRRKQISPNQTETLVKIEKNETGNESNEQVYDENFKDWKIKNEEFELKEEDLESSEHREMSGDSENEISPPRNIAKVPEDSSAGLLPIKSRERYENVYQKFMEWRLKNNIRSFSENVMLAYFQELSEKMKPSSLWAFYSMLRTTINKNDNINIATYFKLLTLLKRKSDGFKSKTSKVLTAENINDFLKNAPDGQYLFMKVVLIVGISGACRKQELRNVKLEHVLDTGKLLVINVPGTKIKTRSFVVSEYFYPIVKKYMNIHPGNHEHNKSLPFFLKYNNGKCTQQSVGINKLGSVPNQIATYLGLPDAKSYTGHCFRRTSMTILVDAGGKFDSKPHGGWPSSTVAKGYIDDSKASKTNNSTKISSAEQKMSSDSGHEILTPSLTKEAEDASTSLLPIKSRERYETVYQKFMEWRLKYNMESFSENVLLSYFQELSEKMKPSSLWAFYSMLRTTININDNINIATYSKLLTLLKQKSDGFKSKNSKVLTAKNINDFLKNAPDDQYLFMKVVLIIGISGACRKQELRNVKLEHVLDTGKSLVINIPGTTTKTQRSFVVSEFFYPIVKKYINIRLANHDNNSSLPFFLKYNNGKCTQQSVGINKLGSVPNQIATYLRLPDAKTYTGHCFRRTSATILVDACGDVTF